MALFERQKSEADVRSEAAQKAAETRKVNEQERSERARKASSALTSEQRSKAAKKGAKTRAANKEAEGVGAPSPDDDPRLLSAPEPATLGANDRRADDQAVVGHFVNVVKGDHKGRYGVVIEVASWEGKEPKTVVVRSRDSEGERLVVPYTSLRPAPAGLR